MVTVTVTDLWALESVESGSGTAAHIYGHALGFDGAG
jgi:hypothetical protein